MNKLTRTLAVVAISVWLLMAVTPRPQTGVFVGNVSPTCNVSGVCTLPDTPRSGTLLLAMNGVVQKVTEDYTISGNTVTAVPANVDLYGDPTTVKVAFYTK